MKDKNYLGKMSTEIKQIYNYTDNHLIILGTVIK